MSPTMCQPRSQHRSSISMVQMGEPQLRKLGGDARGDLPRGPRPPTPGHAETGEREAAELVEICTSPCLFSVPRGHKG